MAALTLNFRKHSEPSPADDMAPQTSHWTSSKVDHRDCNVSTSCVACICVQWLFWSRFYLTILSKFSLLFSTTFSFCTFPFNSIFCSYALHICCSHDCVAHGLRARDRLNLGRCLELIS